MCQSNLHRPEMWLMRNTMGGDGDGFPRVSRRSGEAGVYDVPRVEELVADPSMAGVLDARTARIVATKALGVFMASFCRLLEEEGNGSPSNGSGQGLARRDDPPGGSRSCQNSTTLRALSKLLASSAGRDAGSSRMPRTCRS